MKIEVAVLKEDTTTEQGNLLESFACELLKLQGISLYTSQSSPNSLAI